VYYFWYYLVANTDYINKLKESVFNLNYFYIHFRPLISINFVYVFRWQCNSLSFSVSQPSQLTVGRSSSTKSKSSLTELISLQTEHIEPVWLVDTTMFDYLLKSVFRTGAFLSSSNFKIYVKSIANVGKPFGSRVHMWRVPRAFQTVKCPPIRCLWSFFFVGNRSYLDLYNVNFAARINFAF